jgi:cellulase/cellobiase CelA1
VILQVDDGFGHLGVSNSFNVTDVGGDLSGYFTVTNDWGTGYCVTLNITNNASMLTTNWTATVNTQSTEIYTQWNGNFSGNNGTITITPVGWNNTINPGATDSSVGFCANRLHGGSNVAIVMFSRM